MNLIERIDSLEQMSVGVLYSVQKGKQINATDRRTRSRR